MTSSLHLSFGDLRTAMTIDLIFFATFVIYWHFFNAWTKNKQENFWILDIELTYDQM